jgi:hypothetical protein
MKRKYLLLSALILLSVFQVFSQGYITSLGARVGSNDNFRMAGLSLQQRIFRKLTLEGIVQSDFTKNTTLHLLGEYHQNIVSKYFNFYLGAGLSGGWEAFNNTDNAVKNQTLGADLIAGVELTMLHWNVSLDYKPNFNIYGRESWYQGQIGISVRAVVLTDSKATKLRKEREKRKKERAKEHEKRLKDRQKKKNKDSGKEPEKTNVEEFIDDLLK